MTEQRKKIIESANFVKKLFPLKFKPTIAITAETEFRIPSFIKQIGKIKLDKIPPYIKPSEFPHNSELVFAKYGGKDIIIIKGRYHFYEGFTMREVGHFIYLLNSLGVKLVLGIDEVGTLNPRLKCGDLCLIYDHINFMGDNPLIGENDSELGVRFPDMSEPYNKKYFDIIYKVFQSLKLRINDSVYLGTIGPESETDSEARFFREIGSDILGYSIVPENITAVHCNLDYAAIGMITRELIADKMMEENITEAERKKNKSKFKNEAQRKINILLENLINKL